MSSNDPAGFDPPEIFLSLALALAKQGKGKGVAQLIDETLARHTGDPLYNRLARIISARSLPDYHLTMLQDTARNKAYRIAIEANAKGRVVLDIGTGTGLLAMMAARAGAERVIACEANPLLAQTARQIIEANGLTDRIDVHACHSTELEREAIAPAGVDMVVSEIFSAGLIGEGVLTSLEDARERLCAQHAVFLPSSACLQVALADYEDPASHSLQSLSDVEGFDVSLFERHLQHIETVAQDDPALRLVSNAAQLCRVDFTADNPLALTRHDKTQVTANASRAGGLAQWLQINFPGAETYANGPGCGGQPHWCILFHRAMPEIACKTGQSVEINAFYHGDALALWAS